MPSVKAYCLLQQLYLDYSRTNMFLFSCLQTLLSILKLSPGHSSAVSVIQAVAEWESKRESEREKQRMCLCCLSERWMLKESQIEHQEPHPILDKQNRLIQLILHTGNTNPTKSCPVLTRDKGGAHYKSLPLEPQPDCVTHQPWLNLGFRKTMGIQCVQAFYLSNK